VIETEREPKEQDYSILSKELVVGFNTDGYICNANNLFLSTFNLAPIDLALKSFFLLIHPEDRPSFTHLLNSSVRSQTPIAYTARLQVRDQQILWMSWRVMYTGRFFCGVGIDVTDKIALQRELDIARAKALSSVKMATLGKLIGDTSNDLYESIEMIDELMSSFHSGEEAISEAMRWITRAKRTSQSLGKIMQGNDHLIETVFISELIEDVIQLCKRKTSDVGAQILVNFQSRDLKASCHSVQISQALWNLFDNALESVRGLDKRIIRVEVKSETKSNVKIRISNSGPPLSRDTKRGLFKPFFSTKAQGKGLGLGLNVARNILLSHSGDIELDEAYESPCFTVTLPKKMFVPVQL
jgi:signal transduction histidine kinase